MKVFLAAALLSMTVAHVQAAVISVQPVVAGFFDTNFNPIPPIPRIASGPVFPVVIQVDVMMAVLSLDPGEDSFGTAAFSFKFITPLGISQIMPDPDAGGWAANFINVDSNGAAPGGVVPLFATNGDLGVDNMDLQGILVQMATGAFTNVADPRRKVGEAGGPESTPIRLGTAFLEWNGQRDVGITLNPVEVSVKLAGSGQFVMADAIKPATIWFIQPEPSSAVLMGCCLMGMVFRRRGSSVSSP